MSHGEKCKSVRETYLRGFVYTIRIHVIEDVLDLRRIKIVVNLH